MEFSFPRWIIEGIEDKATAKRVISSYYEGVLYGQWQYSWMKDGVTYVGTTGTLKKDADERVSKEREKALAIIDEKYK